MLQCVSEKEQGIIRQRSPLSRRSTCSETPLPMVPLRQKKYRSKLFARFIQQTACPTQTDTKWMDNQVLPFHVSPLRTWGSMLMNWLSSDANASYKESFVMYYIRGSKGSTYCGSHDCSKLMSNNCTFVFQMYPRVLKYLSSLSTWKSTKRLV